MVNTLRFKIKGWIKKLLPFLFVLLIVSVGDAKDVTLSWDSSPTPSVTGYTLYWSTTPSIPVDNRVSVPCGNVLTFFIANLSDDESHWFAVTAHDGSNNESIYSNIVTSPAISEPLPELNLDISWQILMDGK